MLLLVMRSACCGSHGQWVNPGQTGVLMPKPQQGDAQRESNSW